MNAFIPVSYRGFRSETRNYITAIMPTMFARIAMNLPVDKVFDYRVPEHLESSIEPGKRVYVPFGPRKMVGYCTDLVETAGVAKVKDIIRVIDDTPLLDSGMLRLTRWVANRYACAWGEALEAALPAGVRHGVGEKTEKRLSLAMPVEAALEAVRRAPSQVKVVSFLEAMGGGAYTAADLTKRVPCSHAPIKALVDKKVLKIVTESGERKKAPPEHILTDEQAKSLDDIIGRIQTGKASTVLLHGITGSGKTEIYLRAIENVVERGMQAIVLVPEISLTPQTVERFNERFENVAVLHSKLTAGQRYHQWRRIRSGEADVVVGARSAIFAPTHSLGLIVIDEEHENTFKQDTVPRYHARDVALERARIENAVVVLGSATPSLESFHISENRLILSQRVAGGRMPPATIVNMRDEEDLAKRPMLFSRKLVLLVERALAAGNQTMIFLNRRGFSTLVKCPRCGFALRCSRCDISLTYHKSSSRALCHYCGLEADPPKECPECKFPGIRYMGVGTEKVADIAGKVWPRATIRRMDSDSMKKRTALGEILSEFKAGKIDILVGTQMIAKGHDFPDVTVVGVVDADTALSFPDFRAAERTFQLICQVAGRAGRSEKGGHVVIQTHNPDHYAIQYAAEYDFEKFAEKELAARRALGYPPFGKLARILCTAKDQESAAKAAEIAAGRARGYLGIQVLGPAPAPIERVKEKWRWHVLLKAPLEMCIEDVVRSICEERIRGAQIVVDVDPVSVL
jgi:primosomal protein N' (replication factor Y)